MNGFNKAFIEIDGSPILDRMISVIKPLFSEITIVANENASVYRNYPVHVIEDVHPGKGPLSGIHAALKYTKHDHCFVFACDLPCISSGLIIQQTQLIDYVSDAIVPKHERGTEPLHTIWSKRCYTLLETYLENLQNFKISLFFNTLQIKYFNIQYSHHFFNINTQQDILHFLNKQPMCNELD